MRLVATSGMPTLPFELLRRRQRRAAPGGDGGNARLVPANAGVQDGDASRLQAWASCTTPPAVEPPSTRSSIERRKMMMKFWPHALARAAHDFQGKADAVLVAAAVFVVALVGRVLRR